MNKTIKDLLEELPEPYRTEALENVKPYRLNEKNTAQNIVLALRSSFVWSYSPQGHNYWSNFLKSIS